MAQLVIQFNGWCLMRIPTDPDPTDEPRGASGYTFAFAGEPDLDRILYLQPPDPQKIPPRKFAPDVGVRLTGAQRVQNDGGATDLPAFAGGLVNLLDKPMLQNRNWTLTLPGFEPIVPFNFEVRSANVSVRRKAPLNPKDPDQPTWQTPKDLILAQGAAGMAWEPGTIGAATGIWSSIGYVTERRDKLRGYLKELKKDADTNRILIVNTQARLQQLDWAIANPRDRRVLGKSFVERFSFPMTGRASLTGNKQQLGGELDTSKPWIISFWIGAWDPDALCGYMDGTLTAPYLA